MSSLIGLPPQTSRRLRPTQAKISRWAAGGLLGVSSALPRLLPIDQRMIEQHAFSSIYRRSRPVPTATFSVPKLSWSPVPTMRVPCRSARNAPDGSKRCRQVFLALSLLHAPTMKPQVQRICGSTSTALS